MKTIISDTNKIADMLNLEVCKNLIKDCPKDETVILIPHYSINRPKYSEEENINNFESEDFWELEEFFGCCLFVTDYDDLVADPHGIIDY